jgi:glycerol-3-phosphate dehydrogenase (NAD(P)+)
VAVLGGGKLAHAVAHLVTTSGTELRHWARREEQRRALQQVLPRIASCASVREAAAGADLVVLAVPAHGIRPIARAYGEVATGDQIVVHAARGAVPEGKDDAVPSEGALLGARAFVLPHEAIRALCCAKKIGALGGPLYFEAHGADARPVVAVLGARFDETLELVRGVTQGTRVRLHPTRDIVGVEVASAMGLVAALGAGMAEGKGLGATDEGLLLARGILEAARVGRALGADPATFTGLASLGDLIPRATSTTKRHRLLGARVASGAPLDGVLDSGPLEGIATARAARTLAGQAKLELPLVEAVLDVLDGVRHAGRALDEVLQRDLDLESAFSVR